MHPHASAPAKRPAPVDLNESPEISPASISGAHTQMLTLSPAFHEALRRVAPQRRWWKLHYAVIAALLAIAVVLLLRR
jgi:hypothetical protein